MRTIAVTGVVNDGPVAPGVPSNARVTFRVVRGEETEIELTVVHANGAPFDLTDGEIITTVKSKPGDSSTVLIVSSSPVADANKGLSIYDFPTDGAALVAGRYFIEIVAIVSGGRTSVIPISPLIVEGTLRAVAP